MQLRSLPRMLGHAATAAVPALSPTARTRSQALTVWQHTRDWRVAAQVFGLSRVTLFRWHRRYVPSDLTRLESRSRRPHRLRRSTVPPAVVLHLRTLRQQYPRWGRETLRILLARDGVALSAKTIDRVLAWLRATGQLVEPPRSPKLNGAVERANRTHTEEF